MMKDEFVPMLSRRERDVVAHLLQGKSNKQIALALGVSERTVEFHLNKVYGKLQVASRVELILKLGQATGAKSGNLVESTVELSGANVDNGNQPARTRAANSWRNTFSLIHKEVAMTIHISFEELEAYLRKHPAWLGLLMLITVSLMTRQVLFATGLYLWASYLLLAVALGYGSLRFGSALKQTATLRPLLWLAVAAVLPLLVATFDQLYLNTVLRYTEPIATTLGTLSTTAGWVVSPEGQFHRSTTLSSTSDLLWFVAIGYMLTLFMVGVFSNRRNALATV